MHESQSRVLVHNAVRFGKFPIEHSENNAKRQKYRSVFTNFFISYYFGQKPVFAIAFDGCLRSRFSAVTYGTVIPFRIIFSVFIFVKLSVKRFDNATVARVVFQHLWNFLFVVTRYTVGQHVNRVAVYVTNARIFQA